MNIANYVVNLESRVDRRRLIERELKKMGWVAEFSYSKKPTEIDGFPSIGARGCYLSHLAMLTKGMERSEQHVLIMEDDLKFSPNAANLWHACIDELYRQDWDILYAGHYEKNLPHGLQFVPSHKPILCAHFILFNARIVRTIVDGLREFMERPAGDPNGGPMHVDGAYSLLRLQNPAITTFVFTPSLGHQRPSRSDIAPILIFDRLILFRSVIQAYRSTKDYFQSR